jgi:guanosine-3',5'-bis(diphosphate) 3'-pyrophosphohydrolase
MDDMPPALLDAIAFAARAHAGQRRKDGKTPYVSHVFRVCLIARHLFGVDDAAVLMAAVLHDTIEDTTIDYDDIEERFDAEVAGWVSVLTKEMRLPEARREENYCRGLSQSPWQVRVCKLADIYDNLSDMGNLPIEKRSRVLSVTGRYLDALSANLPPKAAAAHGIVTEFWKKVRAESAEGASG